MTENASGAPDGAAPARDHAGAGRSVGMVVGLRPESEARYRQLHADPWKGVLDRLTASNIRDYSIYIARLDGKTYLFSRFVYTGDDLERDLAAMASDEETQAWWSETDPCQVVLPGTPEGEQWLTLEEVFYHAGE